jgi:hypothetical protein
VNGAETHLPVPANAPEPEHPGLRAFGADLKIEAAAVAEITPRLGAGDGEHGQTGDSPPNSIG